MSKHIVSEENYITLLLSKVELSYLGLGTIKGVIELEDFYIVELAYTINGVLNKLRNTLRTLVHDHKFPDYIVTVQEQKK